MTAAELHFEAMAEADRAIALADKGDHEAARAAFARACTLDTQAAEQCRGPYSRAICYKSAAWLALDAGDPERAIALANKGLEQPPAGRLTFDLKAVRAAAQEAPRKAVTP